jgi:hypothetical protein
MKRLATICAGLMLALCLAGCSEWESTVYKSLASSQTVLNSAQTAYEASASAGTCTAAITVPCIPHSAAAYKAITDGKTGWKLTADSMIAYETAKEAGGANSDAATKAQSVVVAELANVAIIVKDVQALYGGTK